MFFLVMCDKRNVLFIQLKAFVIIFFYFFRFLIKTYQMKYSYYEYNYESILQLLD